MKNLRMKNLLYSILAVLALVAGSSAVCYADAVPLPEPATGTLALIGVAGLAVYTRVKNRKK